MPESGSPSPCQQSDSLAEALNDPVRLRELPKHVLPAVADQLRERVIQSVAHTGGHFAAGLGVIELTVALHHTLDTPRDRLVWDVGHQCYPHKILTGREDRMPSIRKENGISGFPLREESSFDTFGVAHAGTSISAALGMAVAAARGKERRKVCAVIGDGALTSGMAYEALNHAGGINADLMVVLNDNGMSISPNVGALCQHGGDETSSYQKFFESLGFQYAFVQDGHDVSALVEELSTLRDADGPRVLHICTQKGKGYAAAEADPVRYHAVGGLDLSVGSTPLKAVRNKKTEVNTPTFSQVFGDWLNAMADADPELIAITPAMIEGSGMQRFQQNFYDRCIDTGISEQHAVTLAAGLACEGARPVVAIYSSFLQRAYDQVIHDVALQNLPVLFAIDRAGVAGADGATHHGFSDLSYLRSIPNLAILSPANELECRDMLYTGHIHSGGPVAVRYPRGRGPGVPVEGTMQSLPFGQAQTLREGSGIAILAFGTMVREAMIVGEKLNASVVNMRFVKPLDTELVTYMAANHELVVTLEDNAVAGGAGSAVNEHLAAAPINTPILNLGLPDRFIAQGTQAQQLAACGLDAEGILRSIDWQIGEHHRVASLRG